MSSVENVLHVGNTLGEGPVWHVGEQALYWVDIYEHCYHRLYPASGKHEVIEVGVAVGTLAFRANGGYLLATRHGFAFWDEPSRRLTYIHDPEADRPDNRFNDGAVDRQGRFFWAGTMNEKKPDAATGALYRLDTAGQVQRVETGVMISNGIGWSPDNRRMYYTDSPTHATFVYDYDAETGTIRNRRLFAEYPKEMGIPDGLTVDREGCVWVAFFGGWRVARFDPQGRQMAEYRVPASNVTSCTFGGEKLDLLYITCARTGLSEAQRKEQPQAGDLFCLPTDTQGYAEPMFLG